MASPLLLTRDEELEDLLGRVGVPARVSLDCEFHGEKRYRPALYLVQLGIGDEYVCVDAVRVDLKPLRALLESADVQKVVHAGREDLRLLTRASGATRVAGVFDTQIAAAFLGYGLTVGYAPLVKDLLDVELDKSNQFTDWSRSLTQQQIEYALNDVRYLTPVATLLRDALEQRGRLDWALEASAVASAAALVDPDPRLLYRKVNGFAKLRESELGRLRELAAWRDSIAAAEDCRPESVMNDAALKQLAVAPPSKPAQLRGARGVGIGGSEKWWTSLRAAIALGDAEPEPRPRFTDPDPRVESMALLLGVVRRVIATEQDVAAELLASTPELRTLAEWRLGGESAPPRHLDVLVGWRKQLIGDCLLATVNGELVVTVAPDSPSGLLLAPARREPFG
ncbi:MAG TPA: HRDC domain-containing protein [Polyangiaceae bacterium]|nr:HRDC domain-containing protein [Polyangiaceae bacterium]